MAFEQQTIIYVHCFNLAGNEITLIGTVRNDVLNLSSGFDSFQLTTATKSMGGIFTYETF